MKKRAILLTVGLAAALVVTGCGKAESSTTTDYSQYVELGEYTGIEVTVDSTEVTDDEVQTQIDTNLSDAATEEEVTDRAVEDGDTVNIDYAGAIDGVAFDGGTATDQDLVIGSGSFIDDFEEQLIGHEIGETVVVDVTFPDDYSNNEDLAGQDAEFTVTINSISVEVTPELTDEWVAENSDYTTVDEYTQSVRDDLEATKVEEAETNKTADVLTTIMDNTTISGYPEDEIQGYLDSVTEYYTEYASYFGYELEDFLTMYFGTTLEDFNTEMQSLAEETIGRQMVCMVIAEKEGFTISDEEYEEGLANYTEQYQYESTDAFLEEYDKQTIIDNLLIEKVLDYITEQAVEV